MKKACIVLPTYNERENVEKLIPEIQAVFAGIDGWEMQILVVDDNSPDGTGDEVRRLMERFDNVELLEGEKQGLGVAYQRGFRHVMERVDVVFCMDADFSHPPAQIPEFLAQIDEGHTFVIGSRYIPGGGTPDWSWHRKVLSFGGNVFARFVAGLYKVHDCTSGFRAIDTELLRRIDFSSLETRGYAFLTTLLYETYTKGAKLKEIPLVFIDRQHGETKLTWSDIIQFFFNSWRIRLKNSKRMVKFGIVGGSGIVVNLAVFNAVKALLYSGVGQSHGTLLTSSLAGDELSIIWNFILNHKWTFRDSTNDSHILRKLLNFHVVAIMSVVVNNTFLFVLHTQFGMWDTLAKLIGILVAFVVNYFGNARWTWRERI